MLYGNLVFIKKTGGDGSKYPVTERDIKIGRSDNCLIRIYNPQVALEHCQLIIEESGQATLRNLSNQTILNGKPLSHEDVALCHGDIFKLGERLARWEYLPTSKFYKQLLSPTGRLVAVVMPQQRSLEDQAAPGTSASQVSVLKSTPLGKRRFSERVTTENSSAVKIRKSSGSELIHKGRGDLQKLLTGRHSFKTTKLLLKGAKSNERKSIAGIVGVKSSKTKIGGKCRKSTLPSWKVNILTPERKSPRNKDATKSNEKSLKSSSAVHTLLKNIVEAKPEKLLQSNSKSGIITPQKTFQESKSLKSSSKSILKEPIKRKTVSPLKLSDKSARLTRSLSESPLSKKRSIKSPSKSVLSTPEQKSKFTRSVHSERHLKLGSEGPLIISSKGKRINLNVEKKGSVPRRSLIKELQESVMMEKTKTPKIRLSGIISENIIQVPIKNNTVTLAKGEKVSRKSSKSTPAKSNLKRIEKIPRRKSSGKIFKSASNDEGKTLRKSVILNTAESFMEKEYKTPRKGTKKNFDSENAARSNLTGLDFTPKKKVITSCISAFGKSPIQRKISVKSSATFEKTKTPSSNNRKSRINQNEAVSSMYPSSVDKRSTSAVASVQTFTLLKTQSALVVTSRKSTSPSKKSTSPRGVRRKLSPSLSAERAAKKLKTSCPKKPDKNKKAALLVLGKASRKQHASQNVKVLLKQKILKKAIKQSTAISVHDDKNGIKSTTELKNITSKSKLKKCRKKNKSSEISELSKGSSISDVSVVKSPNEFSQEGTPNSKKIPETYPLCLKGKTAGATEKSDSKQSKNSEFSFSITSSNSFTNETMSLSSSIEKSAENYLFNSNRRCSKRLSSKNDTGRPDFVELSPTALGLIPKNIEVFKTPKDKRRSSSLVTPRNAQNNGITKSASTSKISNRKNVRFSHKDIPLNSEFSSPSPSEKTDFDFSPFHTPNITVDVFVSPLTDKLSAIKNDISGSKVKLLAKEISSSSSSSSIVNHSSNLVAKTCVRKLLQSPQSKKKLSEIFSRSSSLSPSSSASTSKSLLSAKVGKQSNTSTEGKSSKNALNGLKEEHQKLATPKVEESSKNSLPDLVGVSRLLKTPKDVKSPKNDLSDLRGIKKLLRTPKVQKSPKNDLTDVRGVKKLLRTPKVQKSPKNDLTDVKGVKKLLQSPKVQKSPKNDLSDLRGVKKLLRTPKVQKSPKNDLTDVRGVKKLLQSPKVQKSPKNDLSDLRGVRKLLRTPKVQKSPKNDLTDVRGVKKLLQSPKVQKSPKNDLSDLRGVRKLLRTPKVQKSPKNDLTDVRGIKKLLQSPKVQKSPKNDLSDVAGVKQLFKSPRMQKIPRNELSDLTGVKRLLGTPKVQKSPKNDLTDVIGVKKLLKTPRGQKSPKNSLMEVSGIGTFFESPQNQEPFEVSAKETKSLSSQSEESSHEDPYEKQLQISKRPESDLKSKKTVSREMLAKDFKAIREKHLVYSNSKSSKNDLSDVTGVRELFSRHKPVSDYNVNLSGVSKLFNLSETEDFEQRESKTVARKRKRILKNEDKKTSTRSCRLRKVVGADEITENKLTQSKKSEATTNADEKKPIKREIVDRVKTSRLKNAPPDAKKSRKIAKKEPKTIGEKLKTRAKEEPSEEIKREIRNSRKRKILYEDSDKSPPKLRQKVSAVEKLPTEKKISRKTTPGSKATRKKSPVKSVQKVSVKGRSKRTSTSSSKVQSKTTAKTGARKAQKSKTTGRKKVQEVQDKRSQTISKGSTSNSAEKLSPRKTRSAQSAAANISKAPSKGTKEKTVKSSGRKKLSPVVKRSTRRK